MPFWQPDGKARPLSDFCRSLKNALASLAVLLSLFKPLHGSLAILQPGAFVIFFATEFFLSVTFVGRLCSSWNYWSIVF